MKNLRLILEQSYQVWHSSLTLENCTDLERVQKNALRIILQDIYLSYSSVLDRTGIPTPFQIWKQYSEKKTRSQHSELRDGRLLNSNAIKKK